MKRVLHSNVLVIGASYNFFEGVFKDSSLNHHWSYTSFCDHWYMYHFTISPWPHDFEPETKLYLREQKEVVGAKSGQEGEVRSDTSRVSNML